MIAQKKRKKNHFLGIFRKIDVANIMINFFYIYRKPHVNILIEKEVQKEDEESSRQK